MKTYIVSYISNSGLTILNMVIKAETRQSAIEQIKSDTGVSVILSCIEKCN